MNCETPGFSDCDLRDYYFQALDGEQTERVRQHLAGCRQCAAELEQLRLTALALRALPEEEMPRRIAFVSDKVFEPSPVMRWFQAWWLSGARLGAVAAMFLGCAILVHAFRPAPVIRVMQTQPSAVAPMDTVAIQAAVDRAVAQSEARYEAKLQRVMAENEREKRVSMARVAEVLESMDRQNRVMTVASNRLVDVGQ